MSSAWGCSQGLAHQRDLALREVAHPPCTSLVARDDVPFAKSCASTNATSKLRAAAECLEKPSILREELQAMIPCIGDDQCAIRSRPAHMRTVERPRRASRGEVSLRSETIPPAPERTDKFAIGAHCEYGV